MEKLIFIGMFLFSGCFNGNNPADMTIKSAVGSRFEIIRESTFKDDLSYSGWRGIYLIYDKETKKQYLGVSGIGVSEIGSHLSGKARISDER